MLHKNLRDVVMDGLVIILDFSGEALWGFLSAVAQIPLATTSVLRIVSIICELLNTDLHDIFYVRYHSAEFSVLYSPAVIHVLPKSFKPTAAKLSLAQHSGN